MFLFCLDNKMWKGHLAVIQNYNLTCCFVWV